MTNEEAENALRALCEESLQRLPLPNSEAVEEALRPQNQLGSLDHLLAEQLKTILSSGTQTGFDTFDLRELKDNLCLNAVIGRSTHDCYSVIDAILHCLPAGTELPTLDDPVWSTAIDLGRGRAVLDAYRHPDHHLIAVSDAGKRMTDRGYTLSARGGAYHFDETELYRASSEIRDAFTKLGSFAVLSNIFRIMRCNNCTAFDMYLPVRNYDVLRKTPSIPYGYLFHLAVGAPTEPSLGEDEALRSKQIWSNAIDLAQDIVSSLNIETYNAYTLFGTKPRRLENALREIALHDHLFCFVQQWPLSLAPTVLSAFFGSTYNEKIRSQFGWTPDDAVKLYLAVKTLANDDPKAFTSAGLAKHGVSRWKFKKMKSFFCHSPNMANKEYASPLAAQRADVMFKPLLDIGDDRYLVPAVSLAGPAFYEATVTALRSLVSSKEVDALQGNGTERVVSALLKEACFNVTVRGATYRSGDDEHGECDFVVESDSDILFIECKAKALTRGSMAGVPGDALLDFAGGMLAAQAQALRHERILRKFGRIQFTEGTPDVVWRDRNITRMSVTLLEHGAIQDRMLLFGLYEALLNTQVNVSDGYTKARQVSKLQDALSKMREEAHALEGLGVSLSKQSMASSLSVGALSIMLDGALDLAHFVRRVSVRSTYMTYNPIFEFKQHLKQGLVD